MVSLTIKVYVFFLIFTLSWALSYNLVFNHYNYELKSYISYIYFTNKQLITDYKNYTIYEFNYPSISIQNELYNLEGKSFPSIYQPPITKEKNKNKNKITIGSTAQIIKDNQIMYLLEYSTPNFYKFLDYELRGLIIALEDNTKELVYKLNEAQKIEFKPYLDYVKAFCNINNNHQLILCYKQNEDLYFDFLETQKNKIKSIKINKFYYYQISESIFPENEIFKF